jgi:hypothetical protein
MYIYILNLFCVKQKCVHCNRIVWFKYLWAIVQVSTVLSVFNYIHEQLKMSTDIEDFLWDGCSVLLEHNIRGFEIMMINIVAFWTMKSYSLVEGSNVSLPLSSKHNNFYGRAIAQAVSRRFPTAASRVRAHVRSCGICGGQSGTGADFLRVLQFPLPILIPPTAPHSSSIIRGWYNTPIRGRRSKWTQSHPTPRN